MTVDWNTWTNATISCTTVLCLEYTVDLVPQSCCAKSQYGEYIDTHKCQRWTLGPPFLVHGQYINEALHNTVRTITVIA